MGISQLKEKLFKDYKKQTLPPKQPFTVDTVLVIKHLEEPVSHLNKFEEVYD